MNAFRKSVLVQGFAWLGILLGTVWWPTMGWGNPTGGQVILGKANISNPALGNTLIQQLSDRALIQWDSFSIAQGELTQFVQPGSSSVALNRVVGATPSMLNGLLQANGNVWLMNSNGVFVGKTGMVDVGGFMGTTLNMSNSDFERGGSFTLSGQSTAQVMNMGTIHAASGDVVLVAREVGNSGSIGAMNGTVAMAGGNEVLVNLGGANGEKVFVSGGVGSVRNDGLITSAASELKAHGNVHALAVQNSGSIRATGARFQNGRVVLEAGDGDISNTGTIEAIGRASLPGSIVMKAGQGEVNIGGLLRARNDEIGGIGGTIDLVGNSVTVQSDAQIDAGGQLKGGGIDVKAGEIVIYGNSTLSANGAAGGDVRLQATGGVLLAGSLSAEGTDGAGGKIVATGERMLLQNGAEVNASGNTGGEVFMGGGVNGKDSTIRNALAVQIDAGARLVADGRNGNGGNVVVYAGGTTRFDGQIYARATGQMGNGGFAELSGKRDLRIGGGVDTSSVAGRNGTLLIDPADVFIGDQGEYQNKAFQPATISGANLSSLLGLQNVVIYTDSALAGNGNITVTEPVQWASDNSLALLASNDILVYNHIRNAGGSWNTGGTVNQKDGTGNIYLVAGWDGTTGITTLDASPATYLDDHFGLLQKGTTYGVGGAGTITIQAGFRNNNATGTWVWENTSNNGVVVGSRYGTTGLAASTVNVFGNTATYGFAQIGFRDNGRIFKIVGDNGNGAYEPGLGETLAADDNYWWYSFAPGSALPGQGLALDGIGTGNLKNPDGTDLDLNTASDRGVLTNIITGTEAMNLMNSGGLVGHFASLVQPEWHALQAYDNTRISDATYAANASAIRGDIVLRATKNVNLVAGINEGYAQIGHVGANGSTNLRTVHGGDNTSLLFYADRNDDGLPATDADRSEGTINSSNGQPLNANRSGAPEVDGAHVFGGDIDVHAGLGGGGYVLLYSSRGTNQMGYTEIGHGGPRTAGVREGNITVDSETGAFLFGGAGNMSYAAIGQVTDEGFHTGRTLQLAGNIDVTTRGLIQMQAVQFGLNDNTNIQRAFVQIGHGGPLAASNDTGSTTDGNNIRIGRNNNLLLRTNYLAGHINVAGDLGVSLEAGNRVFNYAMIGHNATQWISDALSGQGGSAAGNGTSNRWSVDSRTGAISGSDPNNPGTLPYLTGSVKISHGDVSYNPAAGIVVDSNALTAGIFVNSSAGSVDVIGGLPGRFNYTNAGYDEYQKANTVADNVRLAYAMIGSGGYNGGIGFESIIGDPLTTRLVPWTDPSGNITVDAYKNVEIQGGSHQIDFAQIGNGGDSTRSVLNALDEGSITGNVTVLSRTGNINLQGGDAVGYARANITNRPGVIVRDRMYAMVGNGGVNAYFGRMEGDILVWAQGLDPTLNAGNVTLKGGAGDLSFAMVGSGGPGSNDGAGNQAAANRGFDGRITVIASGDVNVLGGAQTALDKGIDTGDRSTWSYGRDNTNGTQVFLNYAQIGHGGPNTQAEIGASRDSTIEVFGTNVNVLGGEGMLSYAKLGHGGSSNVNLAFDLNLDQTGSSTLPTGAYNTTAYNAANTGADAIDVGYLFLIRPGSQITAGPDGILGTGDDGINDGYGEANATVRVSATSTTSVRFFSLYPGTIGNFTVSNLGYGNGTSLSTAVANYNTANPTRQIGFVGSDVNPSTTESVTFTLGGGVNNRFGTDGIPAAAGSTDKDLLLSTTVPGAYDNTNMQSRQAPTDGRSGNIFVYASGDLNLIGGNRNPVATGTYNIPSSFAFAQIGHGGPGGQGATSGDIKVAVAGNLKVDGNFAGDGTADFTMDPSQFLDLGKADQAVLSMIFQTRGGSSTGAVVTLLPSLTLQQNLDNYNTGRAANDQVVINPAFANASGAFRFKTAQTLTLAGGQDSATATVTVTTALGPVTLSARNAGLAGNNIRFQVLDTSTLAKEVTAWNNDAARLVDNNYVDITANPQNAAATIATPGIVTLAGGVDPILATTSLPIAWFSAKHTTNPTTITFGGAPTSILQAVNTWNTSLDYDGANNNSNVNSSDPAFVQRNQRVGFYGVDFDPGGTTNPSAAVSAGATSFVVANAAVVAVGARVTGPNIPANTVVTAINTGTRTVTLNNAVTGTGLATSDSVQFTLLQLLDLTVSGTTLALSGGTTPFIDWNVRGSQNNPAAYLNFLYGSIAPTTLGISTTSGDAFAKIGHGEDVRDLGISGRAQVEPGMFLNNTFAFVPTKGDISVSVGGSADFVAGAVGHIDSQQGSTFTRYVSGNTYLAVSRLDPAVTGAGELNATARSSFASNTVFSSGRDGVNSELRLYAPTEALMGLASTTLLNGQRFTAPAVFNRLDSYQPEPEFQQATGVTSQNTGIYIPNAPIAQSFSPIPGDYSPSNPTNTYGNYMLYFSAAAPPVLPSGNSLPTPSEAFDLANQRFNDQIDRYERVDERSADNQAFTFFNYWASDVGQRTGSFQIDYLGGLGGGNALVMNRSGQLVPMPINLDPNAGNEAKASTQSTEGTTPSGVPVPPVVPKEEKKTGDAQNPFGTSTEGSGVQTGTGGTVPAGGAAAESPDMGMGGAPAGDAPKPDAPAPAPDAPPAKNP